MNESKTNFDSDMKCGGKSLLKWATSFEVWSDNSITLLYVPLPREGFSIGYISLVAITGTTILMPYLLSQVTHCNSFEAWVAVDEIAMKIVIEIIGGVFDNVI